jgi:RNA polymerase sigma factor (sigma-70 family)
MVLGVCRRVLLHRQDAEDAFQATFLVFARKAGSVRRQEAVGGWLYRVAYRTALEARARIARRRAVEQQVKDMPHPEAGPEESYRELLPLLDQELDRLPDKYRMPLVLCELQGRSRKEVARHLGLPEGTLSWRLAHAKKLLAKRLARYGAGALVAVLSGAAASACVPLSLVKGTARAALDVVSGQALTAGVVSAQVVSLTEGVLKVMLLNKLKAAWVVVLALLVGAGAVGLTYRTAAAQPGSRGDGPPVRSATADELEELRLEVAALRKGLEATRQRVKALESEVQTLKAGRSAAGGGTGSGTPGNALAAEAYSAWEGKKGRYTGPRTAEDPLAEAEAALKKLRANPNDKEAADALDRALQRLKAREQKPHATDSKNNAPANLAK